MEASTMKKIILIVLVGIFIAYSSKAFALDLQDQGQEAQSEAAFGVVRATNATKNAIKLEIDILTEFVKKEIIVNAVKKQNKLETSLEEIKQLDQEWVNNDKLAFAQTLQNNNVGQLLRAKVLSNKSLYSEAFLCDKNGAIVGEYPQTSDYWQGDENKFINSFNGGKGKIIVNDFKYDASTKSYAVQISVPVMDGEEAIGVLVVGIKNIN